MRLGPRGSRWGPAWALLGGRGWEPWSSCPSLSLNLQPTPAVWGWEPFRGPVPVSVGLGTCGPDGHQHERGAPPRHGAHTPWDRAGLGDTRGCLRQEQRTEVPTVSCPCHLPDRPRALPPPSSGHKPRGSLPSGPVLTSHPLCTFLSSPDSAAPQTEAWERGKRGPAPQSPGPWGAGARTLAAAVASLLLPAQR